MLAVQDHEVHSSPICAFLKSAVDSAVKRGITGLGEIPNLVPSSRRKPSRQPVSPASILHDHGIRLKGTHKPENCRPAQASNLCKFGQGHASFGLKNSQKPASPRYRLNLIGSILFGLSLCVIAVIHLVHDFIV